MNLPNFFKPNSQNINVTTLKFLTISLFLFYTVSCSEEEEIVTESAIEPIGYENVDERLWPFFEKFEEEGIQRGITVDLRRAGITAEIAELEGERVAGQCSFNRSNPNNVTIDLAFWDGSSERFKEFVVFHELGHCFLFRDHREDVNPNGTCASLMRSGNGTCIDNYRSFTRSTYIDELFDTRFARDIFDNPDI